ncbi:hypothetical protein EX30DRAFT_218179 [Ascodesmis nigricans]|uniref:Uncharacterized protein n=1 Tax=Ascodesmis nigricans TaxID=341454 RepID=A0A4S2MZG3_9PEZI|nr:hypothetical protein EX30DRAFT_218179 [Ascodesmis nigricans]
MSPSNPFNTLLLAAPFPKELIQAYHIHRTNRNADQRTLHLTPTFHPTCDTILHGLITTKAPDLRNCLVLWARPPPHIISLISEIQSRLSRFIHDSDFDCIKSHWNNTSSDEVKLSRPCQGAFYTPRPIEIAGGTGESGVWWMPPTHLHMTVLEALHSVTTEEVNTAISKLPHGVNDLQEITDSLVNGARQKVLLTSPRVGFDGSALAVGFIPVYEEDLGKGEGEKTKWYSYHHLRRDAWDEANKKGLNVQSRYVVPSAHVTIMRYVSEDVKFVDGLERWMKGIEEVNEWLEREGDGVKWDITGDPKGLVWRKGQLWYGGGETVCP